LMSLLEIYTQMHHLDCQVQQKNPIESTYALHQATLEAEKKGPQYATNAEALTLDAFYNGDDIFELAKAFIAGTFLTQLAMQEECKTRPVHEVTAQLYQETITLGMNPLPPKHYKAAF